jgi:hypothetical protein
MVALRVLMGCDEASRLLIDGCGIRLGSCLFSFVGVFVFRICQAVSRLCSHLGSSR